MKKIRLITWLFIVLFTFDAYAQTEEISKAKAQIAERLKIKAIEVDPTAYPAACSNLALLSAQISRFDAAVNYMKKYLMLEPEAEDVGNAQDKIYTWEAQLSK